MDKNSVLIQIQESVQAYAKVIHDAFDIDVDIADQNLVRIAGTGRFAKNISQPFATEGNAFKWVMLNKKPLFIENSQRHEICLGCKNLVDCKDGCELCCPILYKAEVVGVISIGSTTQKQKERVIKHEKQYTAFLETIAEFISAKAGEYLLYKEQSYMLDLLESLINLINEGVMVFDEHRKIRYINKKTELVLGVNLAQIKYLQKIGQFSVHNVLSQAKQGAEYFIRIKDKQFNLIGNTFPLSEHEKVKVFIFQDIVTTQKELYQVSHLQNFSFSSLIGENSLFVAAKERGQTLAVADAHILITGEAGTGREQFARAIHNESSRRDKPFLIINCSAASPVLEKDLFGGSAAQGDADSAEPGVLDLAEGGTLYLQKIDKMEYYLQHKLFQRIESGTQKLRLIASTNCDLEAMAKNEEFYPRLYYLLAPYSVHIPPLRTRRSDILLLCHYYIRRTNHVFGKDVRFHPELMELILDYSWPGNIRELKNVIESIIFNHTGGGEVAVEDLQENLRNRLLLSMDTQFNLARMERQAIVDALNAFSSVPNCKDRIAKALGISRATLYRKLKQYAITEKVLYSLTDENRESDSFRSTTLP